MLKYKLRFIGSGWVFFGMNVVLMLLVGATVGFAAPLWVFWNIKFITEGVEVLCAEDDI